MGLPTEADKQRLADELEAAPTFPSQERVASTGKGGKGGAGRLPDILTRMSHQRAAPRLAAGVGSRGPLAPWTWMMTWSAGGDSMRAAPAQKGLLMTPGRPRLLARACPVLAERVLLASTQRRHRAPASPATWAHPRLGLEHPRRPRVRLALTGAAVASASSSMSKAFQTALVEMAQQNDGRFQAMEDRIAPMEEKMVQVDQMQREIQKFKERWDRATDAAVVAVFAKTALSKPAVEQALAPLVAEAQLNDHVVLEGDAVSQRFLLRCKGAAALAARRVNKLLQLMRVGQGQWREIHAAAPTGAQVLLNLGKDRNRRQVSHELALKRIKQGIEGLLPHKLFMEKDAAALSLQWTQLLRVQIEPPSAQPQVLWNMACIRKLNLDKVALAEAAERFASWNTRAFASYQPRLIKKKLRYLQTHWRGPVALGTQETHAGVETMQQLLGRTARDFVCFASSPIGALSDAGGVATVFPAQTSGDRITYIPFDAVPGRALKVSALKSGAELRHWNVRNHGFTADVRSRLLQHIRADLAWAHADPAARAAVVVGDFNYGDVMEQEVFGAQPPGQAPSGPRAHARRAWEEATRLAVGLAPARATHWHQGLRRASRIGKIMVSIPRWALCQLRQSAAVCGEPGELHINEVSDHVMVIASIAPRALRPRSGPRPHPEKVGHDAALPRDRGALLCGGELGQAGPPPDAYAAYVTSLQAAAKLLQTELLATNGGAKGPNAMIWRQLARAFWRQDAALARVVMAQNPWAYDVVELGPLGQPHQVALKDPAEFERRYTQHLAAVDLPQGAVTTQEGMAEAPAAHWKPVFDPPKDAASERRKARMQKLYLERFATPAPEWDALPPPGPEALR
ncbi:unnamed protein product [Prorocentrum cordatum]|uniref:Endonuclease/exonuclease/phosphatase domain-containing protein n=1 Tax=Prorocentrum cordatum TaxID=2364126 RepID=A0ABN9W2Y9_9DINO|nr:unnamed protein product [Polarella glacialis]